MFLTLKVRNYDEKVVTIIIAKEEKNMSEKNEGTKENDHIHGLVSSTVLI